MTGPAPRPKPNCDPISGSLFGKSPGGFWGLGADEHTLRFFEFENGHVQARGLFSVPTMLESARLDAPVFTVSSTPSGSTGQIYAPSYAANEGIVLDVLSMV